MPLTIRAPFQQSRYSRDLLPGEGAAHLAPRKCDEIVDRGILAGIGAQIGEARDAVLPQRHGPAGDIAICIIMSRSGLKCAAEPDHHFARARGAHRHVKGQHQRVAAGGRGAAHQIEADGMVVAGGAVKLKPEHVGRDLGDLFDGGAADRAERIGNARALRGAGKMHVGARPHDRRPAHRAQCRSARHSGGRIIRRRKAAAPASRRSAAPVRPHRAPPNCA